MVLLFGCFVVLLDLVGQCWGAQGSLCVCQWAVLMPRCWCGGVGGFGIVVCRCAEAVGMV